MFRQLSRRAFSRTIGDLTRVELKHLPYEIGGLEPVVSGHLMDFHYGRHHRAYVTNLNKLQEQAAEALATGQTQKIVELTNAIHFNGGGHLNHEFFWDTLAPIKMGGGVLPDAESDLNKMMVAEWGSLQNFQTLFN